MLTAVMESSDGPWRTWLAILTAFFWSFGQLYLVAVAYVTRDRVWIQAMAGLPTLLLIPYYWYFPESIRWLINKGKYTEATQGMLKAVKINGYDLSEKQIEAHMVYNRVVSCHSS